MSSRQRQRSAVPGAVRLVKRTDRLRDTCLSMDAVSTVRANQLDAKVDGIVSRQKEGKRTDDLHRIVAHRERYSERTGRRRSKVPPAVDSGRSAFERIFPPALVPVHWDANADVRVDLDNVDEVEALQRQLTAVRTSFEREHAVQVDKLGGIGQRGTYSPAVGTTMADPRRVERRRAADEPPKYAGAVADVEAEGRGRRQAAFPREALEHPDAPPSAMRIRSRIYGEDGEKERTGRLPSSDEDADEGDLFAAFDPAAPTRGPMPTSTSSSTVPRFPDDDALSAVLSVSPRSMATLELSADGTASQRDWSGLSMDSDEEAAMSAQARFLEAAETQALRERLSGSLLLEQMLNESQ